MMKYNVALIGCGKIGKEYLEDICGQERVFVSHVVDIDENRAADYAGKFNVPSFSGDYMSVLKDSEVDIVIIATNANSHLSIYEKCVYYKKHVLLEKPISGNIQDGRKLLSIAKSAVTKTLVGHILRFNDSYNYLAGLIHDGEIGRLLLARMVQNHKTWNWDRYKGLLLDCSPIVDCGVHYFDVLEWFSGEKIVSIGGFCATTEPDLPEYTFNYGFATLQLSGSCLGYYEAGWGKAFSPQNVKEFIGTEGRISLTLESCRSDGTKGDKIEVFKNSSDQSETVNLKSKYKPMYKQLCGLIDSIENNNLPVFTIEQAERAFEISIAVDTVIRKNQSQVPVSFSTVGMPDIHAVHINY